MNSYEVVKLSVNLNLWCAGAALMTWQAAASPCHHHVHALHMLHVTPPASAAWCSPLSSKPE